MHTKQRATFLAFALLLAMFSFTGARAADGPYHFIAKIDVGGEGFWDYASVDPAARRLYVAHGAKVTVIDIDRNAVVGEISDTVGVHGFAIASDLGLGFASNGQEDNESDVAISHQRYS